MEPFARTINAAKKYVVSSTLERVDWNAELMHGVWTRPSSSSSESRVGTVPWRREAPSCVGGAGIDR
jgi:hypothetical protein